MLYCAHCTYLKITTTEFQKASLVTVLNFSFCFTLTAKEKLILKCVYESHLN